MQAFPAIALALLATIPVAGCMDVFGDGGGSYEPRVHEYTLVVPAATSETVELYTMNDGEPMRVVAVTFQTQDQQGQRVPNPEIRVKEGDTVILHVRNENPLSHTFHFHGGLVPWEMDGVDYLTQMPIRTGEEYTYVFEDLKSGTYFYHCHVDGVHHQDLGMYGAFIVEERDPNHDADREYVILLDEWDNCHVHGNADPVLGSESSGEFSNRVDCIERFLQDNLAQNRLVQVANNATPEPVRDPACAALDDLPPGTPEDVRRQLESALGCGGPHGHGSPPPQQENRTWWPETHPVYAPIYNTFLMNGKAFPDTQPFPVEEGERVRFRFINAGDEMHSMHVHGHNFLVTHRDGYELESPFRVDTLGIMPAERYDVILEANNPGFWLLHDHVGLHTMNDDHHPGGAMACIAYDGFHGHDAFAFNRSLDCNTAAIEIFEEMGHGHPASRSAAASELARQQEAADQAWTRPAATGAAGHGGARRS